MQINPAEISELIKSKIQNLQVAAEKRTEGQRLNARQIERTFRFKSFGGALAFVEKVGELAEAESHHPDISFGWGYATVSLSTKKIKGLHENDFIMASKIDRVLDRPGRPLARQ